MLADGATNMLSAHNFLNNMDHMLYLMLQLVSSLERNEQRYSLHHMVLQKIGCHILPLSPSFQCLPRCFNGFTTFSPIFWGLYCQNMLSRGTAQSMVICLANVMPCISDGSLCDICGNRRACKLAQGGGQG